MNELSLFTGAGGGIYGSKLLGWRTLGYVEFNSYCQKVIAQRIEDGIFDRAPIFGDIRKFICEGHADSYKGMVDVITAGFPCQPFSVAGNRAGGGDARNMWPQTIDVIRRVQPRYALCALVIDHADVRNLTTGTTSPRRTPVAEYIADFEYEECPSGGDSVTWHVVVEDVKGMRTTVYKLKKRWFEAQYQITIREI